MTDHRIEAKIKIMPLRPLEPPSCTTPSPEWMAAQIDRLYSDVDQRDAEIARLRRKLEAVRDWLKFQANSDGGIVAAIDYSLNPEVDPDDYLSTAAYCDDCGELSSEDYDSGTMRCKLCGKPAVEAEHGD